ncbi:MAG: SDR family oxidoreductase [Porticoccaceae bacterium]|jgi:NAD(P)-dependent dehydrogenase (short-subunit alcohol dehydrogenase family)|nr:SDR family oxidoreductase [Porticoccaceae bacterium]MEA3301609.1 SDR family oxidoreductase [Pseudomonadota bacterium]HLS97312.1 SDR family oxidoreductase [Porticoccaceae bacterium]
MKKLSERTAIITGAGDGIGRAIARRLAGEGANILVADIDADHGAAVAQSLRDEFAVGAEFLATDVRDKAQVLAMVDRAVEHFGGVDILVNNAWGGGTFRRAENKSDAEMRHGLDMNVWACFWAMQAAFPHLKASGRGRIINLCSINGVNAYSGTLEYNVGKEALRAMTRSLAREWAPHQICANVICPAAMTVALVKLLEQSPELAQGAQLPPMGRIGDPDRDIAGVALFLASDDACFVTGNTLFVDGGTHINGGGWNVALPE